MSLEENTLELYLFLICLDYVLWTSKNQIKEKVFTVKKTRSSWYPVETMADADNGDDLSLLVNTPAQNESLLHSRGRHWPLCECK